MATTMKAVRAHAFGGPEVLAYEEVPRPEPKAGEVLVRIHAAGLNPADLYIRQGFTNIPEDMRPPLFPLPFTPGADLSGVVAAVGPEVTGLAEGDAVFGLVRFPDWRVGGRTYAEYTTSPATDLALKPAELSHVEAAALPLAALTAYQLVFDHVGLEDDKTVLVNGAAGGVGHLIVQLAKTKGARVIGVASGRHEEFLRGLGVDQFIDYTTSKVEESAHDIDHVFDAVGGPEGYRHLPVLRSGGTLTPVFFGEYHRELAAERGITFPSGQVHSDGAQLAEVARLVEAGRLRVAIDSVFPLAQAQRAHERGERGHIQGKIVLSVVGD